MPFTLAHPAAAIPLCRPLRRHGVLSALVIGSMVPDFWYLLPLGIQRADTHSLAGLFWFGLPVGLTCYAVFHALLKKPLLGLLPEAVAARLAECTEMEAALPRVGLVAVLASLLLGLVTHLAWDSFTHYDGAFVAAWPALRSELFSIGHYDVYPVSLLQHLSGVVGIGLTGYWLWRWYVRSPAPQTHVRDSLELPVAGRVTVLILLLVAIAWGAMHPWVQVTPQTQAGALGVARAMMRERLAGAGSAGCAALFTYALLWQLRAWRERRGA
jgi:hypothetical protein